MSNAKVRSRRRRRARAAWAKDEPQWLVDMRALNGVGFIVLPPAYQGGPFEFPIQMPPGRTIVVQTSGPFTLTHRVVWR